MSDICEDLRQLQVEEGNRSIFRERDRYKQERDDLLQALFLSVRSREAMFDRILGADPNERKLDSEGDTTV